MWLQVNGDGDAKRIGFFDPNQFGHRVKCGQRVRTAASARPSRVGRVISAWEAKGKT